MKKIKFKNYIILIAIVLFTFFLTFYILTWYKNYKERDLHIPVISEVLREIKYDDIEAITKERDLLFVYLCTSKEDICRNFEYKFKGYINDNDLNEYIVYLNVGYDSDLNNIVGKVYDNYRLKSLKKKVLNYPVIYVFSDGKIIDVLSLGKSPSVKKVDTFLKDYDL